LDKNRKVRMINKEGIKTLCYGNEKKILGLDWFDNFIPRQLKKSMINIFNQTIKKKDTSLFSNESPVLTKNGEEKIISWKNTILFDEKKRVTGILSSGNDVTESKKSAEIIQEYTAELEMFNNSMLGREMRIIELKEEINRLAKETGKEIPYPEIWQNDHLNSV